MLKLIQIEFLKLRRRKFIWLMLLAALFMPLAAVFYFASVKGTGVEPIEFYKWTAFSYTPWIILPVVLGMLCTMLMYNENQYDMPVYPPTMRSSLPAMRRRWTIIPGTFNLRTSGSL